MVNAHDRVSNITPKAECQELGELHTTARLEIPLAMALKKPDPLSCAERIPKLEIHCFPPNLLCAVGLLHLTGPRCSTPAPHMPPPVPPANKGRWYTKNVNRRTDENITSKPATHHSRVPCVVNRRTDENITFKPATMPERPWVSHIRQSQLRIHRSHRRNRHFWVLGLYNTKLF